MSTRIRKPVVYGVLFVFFAALGAGGWLWYRTTFLLRTNDCRIEGSLVSIATRLPDRVEEVLVREGDVVRKGQPLIHIDDRSISARKARAEAILALAVTRWQEAKAGFRHQEIMEAQARLEQARAVQDRAERDFRRIEQLARNDGGVTQADRDAASSTFRAAKAATAAMQEELNLRKEGTRPEVIKAAEAQVQQAKAELDDITVLYRDRVILSPVNGIIAQKLVNPGELVSAGQKLFTIADADDNWLSARIEETRIGQLHIGQEVTFTIDAYPGRTFTGSIYQISPAVSALFSLISTENVSGYFTKIMQRVPIRITLPKSTPSQPPDVVFRLGMQGTIEVTL